MSRPIDRHLVDQLVVEHLPVALRVAKRLVGNADSAEDVMQDALCRVLRHWKSYRGEAAFSTWMMQIVVNVAREHRRRSHEIHELTCDLAPVVTTDPLERLTVVELSEKVRAALDDLPDRQREFAMLRFGEDLPAREIATILQISEANVHSCVHLVRKRIAKTIGVDYVERE